MNTIHAKILCRISVEHFTTHTYCNTDLYIIHENNGPYIKDVAISPQEKCFYFLFYLI